MTDHWFFLENSDFLATHEKTAKELILSVFNSAQRLVEMESRPVPLNAPEWKESVTLEPSLIPPPDVILDLVPSGTLEGGARYKSLFNTKSKIAQALVSRGRHSQSKFLRTPSVFYLCRKHSRAE